jgi:hypothetical protein
MDIKINTKKIFIVSMFIVLSMPLVLLIDVFHPIVGVWIATKVILINLFWTEIVAFFVLKLPPWAIVLLSRPIAMVKRHGTKVIAINITSKLVMKKVGPHAKTVIEKSIRHIAIRKDNFQTKLACLAIKWSLFKYKPPCESPSLIKRLFQNTIIKLIAMFISFFLVIIAIIFLGETQIIKVIKNIIEYILEIDIIQKQVLKKAGNSWFEKLSDKLYNIRFIGGFLTIILIIFLKVLSWIPIIGRYADVVPSKNHQEAVLENMDIQTKYEKSLKYNEDSKMSIEQQHEDFHRKYQEMIKKNPLPKQVYITLTAEEYDSLIKRMNK